MERNIRNAAKALIIKEDKMLETKISDGKEEWYIMPGGGQDVEELLPDTVCRSKGKPWTEVLPSPVQTVCFPLPDYADRTICKTAFTYSSTLW